MKHAKISRWVLIAFGFLCTMTLSECGGGDGDGCDSGDSGQVTTSDIEFVLSDAFTVGKNVEVKIKNVGEVSYVFNPFFEACNLSYFDSFGRKFIIPPGTHCDIIASEEIRPREIKTLFKWNLDECIEDRFGCVKSRLLPEGTYTMRGEFRQLCDVKFGPRTAIAEATIRIVAE